MDCSTCYTIINGVKMTNEEFKAQQRKAKAKAKRAKTLNEIRLLPSEIKLIMKNLKVLRSIVAYRKNGYKQWGIIAKGIINAPQIASPFLATTLKINEVNTTLADIENISKKGEKAVYQYVEKLQYKLDDTQKALDSLLYAITQSGVLSSAIQQHECINGEGRRLGLRILVQRGDKAISEIGRIITKLAQISTKGVNPMTYTISGKIAS